MDGRRDYHTKWSLLDKDKYYTISLINGILKKCDKWTYLQKETYSQTQRKITVIEWESEEGIH